MMKISVLSFANFFFMSMSIARSQRHDTGACYSVYIPPQSRFPQARCRRPIGGNPTIMGVFMRNDKTCCRSTHAGGWGSENNCRSCSSIRGSLYPWTAWSSCSRTCGWGEQLRYRVCSNAVCEGVRGRRKTESRSCLWKACCPVDGDWADWSSWTRCSATCGEGRQYRTRSCSSPLPSCGGITCRGYPRQTQTCHVGQCSNWSSWKTASPCSVTCGVGTVKRTRECHNPLGDICIGEPVEYLPCDKGSCAVDGGWCTWSPWSICTSTCHHVAGTRKRSRLCGCPVPQHGGRECFGSDGDVTECSPDVNCPVNGGWSDWSPWGECSSEKCATAPGIRIRTRHCDNPFPRYGGTCEGQGVEKRQCININDCELEGFYGEWSPWSPCTSTCGLCSFRMRDRQCVGSISMPDIDLIGTPQFRCKEQKDTEEETCEVEECEDGSDSCDDNDYYYSSSGEDDTFISTFDDEDIGNEADVNSDDLGLESYDFLNFGMAEMLSKIQMEDGMDNEKLLFNDENLYDEPTFAPPSENTLAPSSEYLEELEFTEDPSDEYSGSDNVYTSTGADSGSRNRIYDVDLSDGSGINHGGDPEMGCELLDNIIGEDGLRAVGCCDLLKKDLTNDTNLARLQECFSLHFEYVVSQSGDSDPLMGRTWNKQCRYKNKPQYLRTICCAYKSCHGWKRRGLRDQCYGCRDAGYCQSCHHLILNP